VIADADLEACPYLDEVNLVVGTESFDELEVLGFRVRFNENAQVSLALVQCLCAFTKTTGEAVVLERYLQDVLHAMHLLAPEKTTHKVKEVKSLPEEHPPRSSFPWGLQWLEPLGFLRVLHLQRQTSCRNVSLTRINKYEFHYLLLYFYWCVVYR
jgi:hypothetical protein